MGGSDALRVSKRSPERFVYGSLEQDGVHVPIILAGGAFSESAFRCVAPATALSGV